MKKSFKLENLGCASCAAKMEDRMNKMNGVTASISFMTRRLNLEADDAIFEESLAEARKIVRKIEPYCEIR